ncbi:MAG TPA: GFA family protein [Candidatus Binatia bacterium]
MRSIEGGCLCGAVRYRAYAEAYGITHCHCRTCRRASGAAFVTWAGFDTDKFTFIQGKPTSYASSATVVRTFCGECGTALTYQRDDLPGSIDVTLGSMDDPEALRPQDHTGPRASFPGSRWGMDFPDMLARESSNEITAHIGPSSFSLFISAEIIAINTD